MLGITQRLQQLSIKAGTSVDRVVGELGSQLSLDVSVLGRGGYGVCIGVTGRGDSSEASDCEDSWAIKLAATRGSRVHKGGSQFAEELNVASKFCRREGDTIITYRGLLPCISVQIGNMPALLMPQGMGSLKDMIWPQRSREFVADKVVLYDILNGVAKMHAMGFAHHDLKPENIITFMDEDDQMRCKICDFGWTCSQAPEMVQSWAATIEYRPIESIFAGNQIAKGSRATDDIWAVGCILYELMTLQELCTVPSSCTTHTHIDTDGRHRGVCICSALHICKLSVMIKCAPTLPPCCDSFVPCRQRGLSLLFSFPA